MRNYWRILCLIFFVACNGKPESPDGATDPQIPSIRENLNDSRFESRNDTLFFQGNLFSGIAYHLFPETTDTASLESYRNGRRTGITQKYYPNGQLWEEREYRAGRKNGHQRSFWENGNRRFEFNAVNDQYEGKMEEWDVDGKLTHLGNYENGQESGEQKMWNSNGKIRSNYIIKNGRRYGLLGTKNCENVSDSIPGLL